MRQFEHLDNLLVSLTKVILRFSCAGCTYPEVVLYSMTDNDLASKYLVHFLLNHAKIFTCKRDCTKYDSQHTVDNIAGPDSADFGPIIRYRLTRLHVLVIDAFS